MVCCTSPACPSPLPLVDIEADVVALERFSLKIVIALHVFLDRAGKRSRFHFLAIALFDRRTIAVGSRNEAHVLAPDPIAQKACEAVSGHEYATNMPEVQRLIAVGHAQRSRPHDAAKRYCD